MTRDPVLRGAEPAARHAAAGRPFALCADDYAITPGVSRGILEALDAGALSAVSVMTTSACWPDDAPALRQRDGRADVGLHLNLTLGQPLDAMPIFAPSGRLPDVGTLIRRDRAGQLPADEIAAEIDRQCDRFAAGFGRAPDHVDGHQHVHALRGVRSPLLASLERRGWRPWIRDSADRLWRMLPRAGLRKAIAVALVAHGHVADLQRRGFASNDGFAGFSRFDPSDDYASLFESYLKSPGPRHLVMCHPGYVDDLLRRLDPVTETREQELRFLTGAFGDTVARSGATLARLSGGP